MFTDLGLENIRSGWKADVVVLICPRSPRRLRSVERHHGRAGRRRLNRGGSLEGVVPG